MINFSKAFDTVNHQILLSKLKRFPIPVNVIKWMMSRTDRILIARPRLHSMHSRSQRNVTIYKTGTDRLTHFKLCMGVSI